MHMSLSGDIWSHVPGLIAWIPLVSTSSRTPHILSVTVFPAEFGLFGGTTASSST